MWAPVLCRLRSEWWSACVLAPTACSPTTNYERTHRMLLPPAGAVVRDFGQADLKEVERRLFEPSQSVSAWFAPEVKLGALGGSMEAPQCFGAEIYAQVGGGCRHGGVFGVLGGAA